LNKNLVVGLHVFGHDANLSTFDLKTKEFKYLKFERITGVKWQCHDDLTSWIKYLNYLNYGLEDIISIFLVNCSDILPNLSSNTFPNRERIMVVDHHECHHHSTSNLNSIVLDDTGSQHDCLSIFKKHKIKEKLFTFNNYSLGKVLQHLWKIWFLDESQESHSSHAGHCMALSAFGKDYSEKISIQFQNRYSDSFFDFLKKDTGKDHTEKCNNYVTSLHFYWFKKIKNILKKYFDKNQFFSGTGGVGENIILNTLIKNEYPNFEPSPHCGDEGTSIGALIYGLKNLHRIRTKLNFKNLHQHDENFGFASQKTIKKVAKLLYDGKLVMWGQGWGEVGPRALGFRSILMNPCVANAKEIINDKVKKRVWFRPYGASVPTDTYKTYFDLDYESPWMLYQAKVKDPVKFKNITHADGTCRIQTVDKDHNPTFLKLLKEFEKLSGYPVLINTSLNIPGKPIVGTKKQAIFMFDNSQADVLVIGDGIYTK